MGKREIENELNDLQEKLTVLKSQVKSEEDVSILHLIKQLEDNSALLKNGLFREITPIERVQLARHPDRPTTLDYIKYLIKDFMQIHGDRRYMDDNAIIGGIGFFEKIPVTIIGHQKGRGTKDNIKRNFGSAYPEGYRKAIRLMKQAEKFNRPVIIFIDTPAAYPGIGAEERGQAEAIAYNLYEMSTLRTQIISIVTGEGGSGGALGLGVADRVFMLTNTFYSVIPPEGCASILWKDSKRADEAACALKIDPDSLLKFGVVDDIIAEPLEGINNNYEEISSRIKDKLLETINDLKKYNIDELIELRYKKFRGMGNFTEK
jgi:acetyl-CoA carboxylase carboxyl transferase subunit alpha